MNGVYNDRDLVDIRKVDGLVNTTSYCKEFSFSSCDINGIVYCFDDWSIMAINVEY